MHPNNAVIRSELSPVSDCRYRLWLLECWSTYCSSLCCSWSCCSWSLILTFCPAASSAYTGIVIGFLIATLIVGSATVLAKALYSSRHQICLGNSMCHLTFSYCLEPQWRLPGTVSIQPYKINSYKPFVWIFLQWKQRLDNYTSFLFSIFLFLFCFRKWLWVSKRHLCPP